VDVLDAAPGALRNLRRHMQLIFQNPTSALNPRLSIGRSIAEPFVIHNIACGIELRRRVDELLNRVGLHPRDADRYPHELSGGQKQRVGIARAIALSPKLIICDEPISALDVAIQSQILNLLSDLQEELGLTYLFIAHNLAVIKHFCDRVAVMYLGKIVETATTSELYRNPCHPYTQALLQTMPGLDPAGQRATRVLEGDVPDPACPPPGCPFHPRCPQVTDECRHVAPLLESIPGLAANHIASCHNVAPVSV
jgi:oligopeptide/dipeptide ABC transporter ATP-binding protein